MIFTALFTWCFAGSVFAQDFPGMDALKDKKPVPQVQEEKAQWTQIIHRATDVENRTRKMVNAVLLMFLFGAFCVIWAQNTGRNVYLWFLAGFVFTVFAILAILWLNPRQRNRKKRYNRRGLDYSNLVRF